MGVSLPF